MDPATLSDHEIAQLLEMAEIGGDGFPDKMAQINEMLNALPAGFRERLLVEYTNNIF
jgi:sphinganine-1-phosphate aldolase